MPIVSGTYNASVRKANTAMSAAFFSRAKEWLYPRICGSYITTSLTEPHAILGAAPPLKIWNGSMTSAGIPSWTLTIPNLLFKNIVETDRTDLEGDQTHSLLRLADQLGVALADFPDQLLAKRILTGSLTANVTESFLGGTYTTTMDGLPLFSLAHKLDGATSQANILTGTLPTTSAAMTGDLAVYANDMQKDLRQVVAALKTVKDNQNMPIFPTLDTKKNIIVVVPPCLEVVADLAFRTAGTIGGTNGSASGSTTSVGPMYVKDVFTSGYLAGLPDPEAPSGTISPTHETDWYVFVTNDYVRPFYVQLFKPVGDNGLFPPGYDVDKVAQEALKESKAMGIDISRDAAYLFASTIVEHNYSAVGSNAQESTVFREKFFASARYRGNVLPGPWFTAWKIDPTGTSS